MSSWNDDKLDHLDRRVDEGFKRMDKEFQRVDQRFEKVDQRFDILREEMQQGFAELRGSLLGLHRMIAAGAIVIVGALIGFHG